MMKPAFYFYFFKNYYVYFGFDFVLWSLITLGLSLEPLSSFRFWCHLTFSPKKISWIYIWNFGAMIIKKS